MNDRSSGRDAGESTQTWRCMSRASGRGCCASAGGVDLFLGDTTALCSRWKISVTWSYTADLKHDKSNKCFERDPILEWMKPRTGAGRCDLLWYLDINLLFDLRNTAFYLIITLNLITFVLLYLKLKLLHQQTGQNILNNCVSKWKEVELSSFHTFLLPLTHKSWLNLVFFFSSRNHIC